MTLPDSAAPLRRGIGEWVHLVQRFFGVLAAPPLTPSEQDEVAGLLRDKGEARIFWDQPIADQRHGLVAARHVLRAAPERRDLARAALLHDVGKRHARLGILARSVAGLLRLLGLPGRGRIGLYLEHGRLGAGELEEAGAEPLVVAFARHHHEGQPPTGINREDWRLLIEADHVRG